MNPRVRRWQENWWTLTFTDVNTGKRRNAFADSWQDAMSLVAHGYQMGYLRGK
jgi:hypothetical protein